MTETKKDLTGLFDLAAELKESGQEPPAPEGLVFEETPIDQVDSFDSLESMGQTAEPESPMGLDFLNPPEPTDTQNTESEFTPPATQDNPDEIGITAPQVIMPAFTTPQAPTLETERPQKIPTAINAAIPAAFPFTLLIEGPLTSREKEKLVDIINREKMGIREIDLEPQLEGGKVLIPRISEFAGIYLIQQLRETRAKITFGPTDEVFAAQGTTDETQPHFTSQDPTESKTPHPVETQHPADSLPVTTERFLPGLEQYTAIDTLIASGTLQTFALETDATTEYQDLLTSLQRELKFKARRRGATGIIHFKIQLTPLTSPSCYRVTVMGLAIKPR